MTLRPVVPDRVDCRLWCLRCAAHCRCRERRWLVDVDEAIDDPVIVPGPTEASGRPPDGG